MRVTVGMRGLPLSTVRQCYQHNEEWSVREASNKAKALEECDMLYYREMKGKAEVALMVREILWVI